MPKHPLEHLLQTDEEFRAIHAREEKAARKRLALYDDVVQKVKTLRERLLRGERPPYMFPVFVCLFGHAIRDAVIRSDRDHKISCIQNYYVHCAECNYDNSLLKYTPRVHRPFDPNTYPCTCKE